MPPLPERCVYVAWRRPDALIVPVGVLTRAAQVDGGGFRFVYLKRAEVEADFEPLPGLPDLHRVYESASLFPVFANRVMPRERPDYADFVEQLNLLEGADPFEVLARSEGVRATDRIEVFPAPVRLTGGRLETRFFVRGIRHLEGSAEAVERLSAGDELVLVDEPDNPVNPRAILLDTATNERVGWVPDYLLDVVHDLRELNGTAPTVTVEHVNPVTTAPHLRVLCRIVGDWPEGFEPLSGSDFRPLAD